MNIFTCQRCKVAAIIETSTGLVKYKCKTCGNETILEWGVREVSGNIMYRAEVPRSIKKIILHSDKVTITEKPDDGNCKYCDTFDLAKTFLLNKLHERREAAEEVLFLADEELACIMEMNEVEV